jgi:hypothetical protein
VEAAPPQQDLILFCIAGHTIKRMQSGKHNAINRDNRPHVLRG